MTGVGIVLKMAPIFPNNPIKIIMTPLATITIRLPTCKKIYQLSSFLCATSTVVVYFKWRKKFNSFSPLWCPVHLHSHYKKWFHCLCPRPRPTGSPDPQSQSLYWLHVWVEVEHHLTWHKHGSHLLIQSWRLWFLPGFLTPLLDSQLVSPTDLEVKIHWIMNKRLQLKTSLDIKYSTLQFN